MIVLTYGFQQPQNGDPGSVWFPALNVDIQKLNDHDHDGINSAPINATSISAGTVSILAANWVLDIAGRYKQTVSTPAGYNIDSFNPLFRITGGDIIYPSVHRLNATSFVVYTLDNTLSYTAVFR